MNIHLKIKECVDKKGAEIILSYTLVNMLDDEQVFEDIESAPYKKILRNIIKEGYAQKLLDLGSYTSDVSFLASQYAQTNLMQEGPVLYVLDCLAYGLGWMTNEPTLQATSSQENSQTKSAPTPVPQEKKESGSFFSRLFSIFGSSSTKTPSQKTPPKPRKPQKTGEEYFQDAKTAKANGDLKNYFDSLKKAANKGIGEASMLLGNTYLNGENVVKNEEEAIKWFTKGAQKGNESCIIFLGFMYVNGQGVQEDMDKAMSYFKKVTKDGLGDMRALFGMGLCYYNKLRKFGGTATTESLKYYADAERWLLAAASKGSEGAQFFLGELYIFFGPIHQRVVDYKEDHKKAYEWYRKAADQGSKRAKDRLWELRGYWPGKKI